MLQFTFCILLACLVNCNDASPCFWEEGRRGAYKNEIKVGNQKRGACVDACLHRKETSDGSINGVKVLSNDNPGCWCLVGMYDSGNTDAKVTICFISKAASRPEKITDNPTPKTSTTPTVTIMATIKTNLASVLKTTVAPAPEKTTKKHTAPTEEQHQNISAGLIATLFAIVILVVFLVIQLLLCLRHQYGLLYTCKQWWCPDEIYVRIENSEVKIKIRVDPPESGVSYE